MSKRSLLDDKRILIVDDEPDMLKTLNLEEFPLQLAAYWDFLRGMC